MERGSRVRRAPEEDLAAERLDAVLQAGQAGAAGDVGAAAAVVTYRYTQDAGDGLDADGGFGGVRVLGRFVSASETT